MEEPRNSSLYLGADGRQAGTCKWCMPLAVVDQVASCSIYVFLSLGHLPSLLRLDAAGTCSPGLPHWLFKWQLLHLATYLPGQPSALSLSSPMVHLQNLGYEWNIFPQHKPGIVALFAHITKAHREQDLQREVRSRKKSVPTESSSLRGMDFAFCLALGLVYAPESLPPQGGVDKSC